MAKNDPNISGAADTYIIAADIYMSDTADIYNIYLTSHLKLFGQVIPVMLIRTDPQVHGLNIKDKGKDKDYTYKDHDLT